MSGGGADDEPAHDSATAATVELPPGLQADFDAIRPRGEAVDRARVQAKLKKVLFDTPEEPVKLGRFVILNRLGAGAMGVVYKAYDPHLDRRVALKLVSTGSHASDHHRSDPHRRLWREAQSLARLSHPNVVPVHEVGVLDDQIFIVMEFVVGRTLAEWRKEQAPSWQELLAGYIQAGRGLGAAHARDLVHRDFKPANAIIGRDQRVRVLDFGLARTRRDVANLPRDLPRDLPDELLNQRPDNWPADQIDKSQPHDGTLALNADTPVAMPALTATNVIVGTPAYMAPEQLRGLEVGPASDQFSFCVALYEALYGQRPYGGRSLSEIEAAYTAGRIAEPPASSRVPGWLYPVLCRGLQFDADNRYASMEALIEALEDDPVRKVRRRLAVAAVVAMLATTSGLAVYAFHQPAAAPPCAGVGEEIGELWNSERRTALQRVFRNTGRTYAAEAWEQVEAGIARYTDDWAIIRQDACETHQRGLQSGDMLDRRMACLDSRTTALGSALTVLADTDAQSLARVVDVVQQLPALAYCGDTAALAAEVPPPQDADMARDVAALRARLSLAVAHEHGNRYQEALAIAEAAVAEAETVAYEPAVAESLLVAGRITMRHRGPSHAIALLHRATSVAVAAGVDRVALEALARRLWADGVRADASDEQTAVMRDLLLPLGEALARRTPNSAFGHALLLNNAGVTYMAGEDRDRARDYFSRALAIQSQAGLESLELGAIHFNLALTTPDEAQRLAVFDNLLDTYERALGPSHLETLDVRTSLAYAISDPQRARDVLEQAWIAYRDHHPERLLSRAKYTQYLALLAIELGDRARARDLVDELSNMAELPDTASTYTRRKYALYRHTARGYAALYRGRPELAFAPLARALEQFPGDEQRWWIERDVAIARLGIGLAELALGRFEEAASHLEQARVVFQRASENNENADNGRWLARAQVALATSLWHGASGRSQAEQRARAEALVDQARAWYRAIGLGYRVRLEELERWPDADT